MPARFLHRASAAAALLLSLPSASAFFHVTPGSLIAPVAASDRVSELQQFARHADIYAVNEDLYGVMPLELVINVPGRVFISYVEKKEIDVPGEISAMYGYNTTAVGKLKVSGSSEAVVAYIDLASSGGETSMYYIEGDYTLVNTLGANDALLIEVELYRKEMINKVQKGGNSDLVILDHVIYTPRDGAGFTDNFLMGGEGNGDLFIHDPTATLAPETLFISALQSGSGTMQIEVAKLQPTKEFEVTIQEKPHNISLFVEESSAISLVVEEMNAPGSELCIASKKDVTVIRRPMIVNGEVSKEATSGVSSVRAAGGTCAKKPLPERVPALINQKAAAGSSTGSSTGTPSAKESAARGDRKSSNVVLAILSCTVLVLAMVA